MYLSGDAILDDRAIATLTLVKGAPNART